MKSTTVKFFRYRTVLLCAAAAVFLTQDACAFSLFGSEKRKMLEEADAAYDLAVKANAEGRPLEAVTQWNDARSKYDRLLREYPDFKTEHTAERLDKCTLQMRSLTAKISSGEIQVPSPEQVVAGHGDAVTSEPADPNEADAAGRPESGNAAKPSVMEKESAPEETLFAAEPDAYVVSGDPGTPAEEIASMPSEEDAVPVSEMFPSDMSTGTNTDLSGMNDAQRRTTILYMLDSSRVTDAILSLDDVIEKEGNRASPITRLLFARALMSRGNYDRAMEQLDAARRIQGDTPAVRTLNAALAVGMNRLHDSMYQLDRLADEYPDYADTFVNLAYLSILMDPIRNRDTAVRYYNLALSKGAARDPKLERELKIEVAR